MDCNRFMDCWRLVIRGAVKISRSRKLTKQEEDLAARYVKCFDERK